MKTPLILLAVLTGALGRAQATPAKLFDAPGEPRPAGAIDRAVFARLKKRGIQPARVCSDAVFVRRVYLDVLGTLPTGKEALAFLRDGSADKRRVLIDGVLKRKEFPDYWAMKWGDMLRVKAEFPINLWPNATQAYYLWIHKSLRDNVPYDRLARELLTSSGSNFREPPVNFYRALQGKEPRALAQAAALTFLGARAGKWKKNRLDGLAAFFAQVGFKKTQEWKEEVVYFDSVRATRQAADGTWGRAVFPDGQAVRLTGDRDPREVFADWLITPKNPYFARNLVNRAWCWLLGRGIIHEPDDIRPDNPPSNPELLALLEKEFVAAKYDFKALFRLILNSTTYQLSSVPRSDKPEAAALFAQYPVRRLEAEVLVDALCQITGTTEQYSSNIPEPFTFIPESHRSIALPDGSITSSFLEMFGRPPRDTGMASERTNRMTPAQRLHLLNSSHVREKIERSRKLRTLMRFTRGRPRQNVHGLYLAILSRLPTEEEVKIVGQYAKSPETKSFTALVDLAWALVNSSEFLYRH